MIDTKLLALIKKFLPQDTSILTPQNPKDATSVQLADLDGDGVCEIVLVYKCAQENHLLVLKNNGRYWYRAADIKGTGYALNYFLLVDITGDGKKEIIVGWQSGGIWSQADVFTWGPRGLRSIMKDKSYSKLYLISSDKNKELKVKKALALWRHETGEAYSIKIYRYSGKKLTEDNDLIYKEYFKKVANYYESKVKEMPDAAFYWYYLADAQIMAGMSKEALNSIETGMDLNLEYPSKKEFLKLKNIALLQVKERNTT